ARLAGERRSNATACTMSAPGRYCAAAEDAVKTCTARAPTRVPRRSRRFPAAVLSRRLHKSPAPDAHSRTSFRLSSEKAESDKVGIPRAIARTWMDSAVCRVRAMRRPAIALMLGWLLWVEMEHPQTHVWFQVDRKEFATHQACEHERNGMISIAQRDGAGTSFMMSRPEGV